MMNGPRLNFDGRVAIVTGAGGGLGRAHSLLLAARGAKVVVNDTGRRGSDAAAAAVAAEIDEAGGVAVANTDTVEEGERIVECAIDHFGRADIVVNNAGNLHDRAFHNMNDEEWEAVYRVHLLGAFKVTRAAWPHFRDRSYGRVVFTSSGSGVYGSFGQANYAAAKLGLYGLAQTLALEGAARNVLVNAIAPAAGSQLSATVWPAEVVEALRPEYVSPLVAYLCHETCETNGALFEVGGGWISRLRWQRSQGVYFTAPGAHAPEDVARNWKRINDFAGATNPASIADAYAPLAHNMPQVARQKWQRLMDGE